MKYVLLFTVVQQITKLNSYTINETLHLLDNEFLHLNPLSPALDSSIYQISSHEIDIFIFTNMSSYSIYLLMHDLFHLALFLLILSVLLQISFLLSLYNVSFSTHPTFSLSPPSFLRSFLFLNSFLPLPPFLPSASLLLQLGFVLVFVCLF